MEDMKQCTVCKEIKPTGSFYMRSASKDGISYRCKECDKKCTAQHQEKNPGCGVVSKRKWRRENPEKYRAERRKSVVSQYGLTVEEYDKLLEAQNGGCAICGGVNRRGQMLSIDHCHKTGKVRGLLCAKHNLAIAGLGDTAEGVRRAAEYLSNAENGTWEVDLNLATAC